MAAYKRGRAEKCDEFASCPLSARERKDPESSRSRAIELRILTIYWLAHDARKSEEGDFAVIKRRMAELAQQDGGDSADAAAVRAAVLLLRTIELSLPWEQWPATTLEMRERVRESFPVCVEAMREVQRVVELEPDPQLQWRGQCYEMHFFVLLPRQHELMSGADWDRWCGVGGAKARQAVERYDFDLVHDRWKASSTYGTIDHFLYASAEACLLLHYGDLATARAGFAKQLAAWREIVDRAENDPMQWGKHVLELCKKHCKS